MAPGETPAQWWVNEMAADADPKKVTELADRILNACMGVEIAPSELYMAQARAFAITLMDAGRSGRSPEHLKNAACEIMALWLDAVGDHIKRKQN